MKFKRFQLEDIARAALLDGAILALEPGLGKTLCALAWALVKNCRRVLLVVPGQLHDSWQTEARQMLGIHLTTITHRRDLRRFGINKIFNPVLPTRFFITTYQNLGFNNTRDGSATLARHIAALPAGAGFDAVAIDEGTRLQSTDTHIAQGVRTLKPKHRLILTGTPIKNRLESFFWLAWWAGGERWPYPGNHGEREQFARDFLMTMRPDDGGRSIRTPRITNHHNLWALIAPIVIRRRKTDCGEEIVSKIVKPVRLQPGTLQQQVYKNHLFFPPTHSRAGREVKGFSQVAMQLNFLRQAALCPHSPSLGRVQNNATGLIQSPNEFNPKLAACLSIIARLIAKGEQVIVGSPFRTFSETLHDRLCDAGVRSVRADGETLPSARGDLAADFKRRKYSVFVVGIASMGEGNDFPNCSHLILPSLSWAFDENEQFINRIWRLNSPKPVTVYTLSIIGTIDDRLAEVFSEKSESSQLALDRGFIGDQIVDVDLATLLRHAIRAFRRDAATIDESEISHQWKTSLRARLARAQATFSTIPHQKTKTKKLSEPPTTLAQIRKRNQRRIDWPEIRRIVAATR